MIPTSAVLPIRMSSGLSGILHPVQAAEHAAASCIEGLGGARADLVTMFFSPHHLEAAAAMASAVRTRLDPACFLAVSAEAVLGGDTEMEKIPGVSVLAGSLPGVRFQPFRVDELPVVKEGTPGELAALGAAAGLGEDHRATLLFLDPFSVPANKLLPSMSAARRGPMSVAGARSRVEKLPPIIGGMASASAKRGGNVLILNDQLIRSGGIGVSLTGPIRVDSVVSQGCKPLGHSYVVTGAKQQMITTLGGREAVAVMSEVLDTLDEAGRNALRSGLFIGRAINEYKERFGRDNFLIRNVVGVDKTHGAVAVADLIRVGQTVQFFARDRTTADEDLALLLDAQKLYDRPAGAMVFTCNGRGTRLFERPHHDAAAFTRAFASAVPAEEQAKGGELIARGDPHKGTVPLAGFFAAGEIGPVGDEVFVHGQAVCAALFRSPGAE